MRLYRTGAAASESSPRHLQVFGACPNDAMAADPKLFQTAQNGGLLEAAQPSKFSDALGRDQPAYGHHNREEHDQLRGHPHTGCIPGATIYPVSGQR